MTRIPTAIASSSPVYVGVWSPPDVVPGFVVPSQ